MTTMNVLKKLSMATAGAAVMALTTVGMNQAEASTIVLDFEGVGNLNPVGDFYNDDYGITFSPNTLGLVDSDAGGSGNFGGEPSGDTGAFFLGGGAAVMNVANGFTDGFSFFYSSPFIPGFVNVYDGLNGTGNLLTSLSLPLTPRNGAPDPTGVFSPFLPFGASFSGVAKSVDFGGAANAIVFDNITLGSATPVVVPEPASLIGILGVSAFGVTTLRKRKATTKA
ncbi:MAG: PEP-CTERM sorting domain-containing protein [Sphaerospermopsis sp. SIO1G2]|nr:PEP-CTERM sorting domain-containing protein [Sphaerospermopsis sp. SIO1G2]